MARGPLTRRWTDKELEQLKTLLLAGFNVRAIAFRLKRTPAAVDRMLLLQGLSKPHQVKDEAGEGS